MASDLSPIGVPGGSYPSFTKHTNVTVTLTGVESTGLIAPVHKKRVIAPYSALGPAGLPTGRYDFDDSRNTELDGVESTSGLGTLAVDVETVVVLDSLVATSGLGTIIGTVPVTVALSGTEATGAIGTQTVNLSSTVTLNGVELEGEIGAIVTELQLDSLVATTGLGTLGLSTEQYNTLSGVSSTTGLGTLSLSVDSVTAITGNAITTGLGTVTATVPAGQRVNVSDLTPMGTPGAVSSFVRAEPVIVSIDGVAATCDVAAFDGLTSYVEPDDVIGTSAVGTVAESTDQTVIPTGVESTTAIGSVVFTSDIVLDGVESAPILGTLSVSAGADTQTELGNVTATSGLGSISVTVDAVITPAGVAATGAIGTVTQASPSVTVIPDGVSTTVESGTIDVPFFDVTVTLAGVESLAVTGVIYEPGTVISNPNATTSVPNNYEQCDRSGFRVIPGGLHKNWNGVRTRRKSIDHRHPQEAVRATADRQRGPQRPEQNDRFIGTDIPEVAANDL